MSQVEPMEAHNLCVSGREMSTGCTPGALSGECSRFEAPSSPLTCPFDVDLDCWQFALASAAAAAAAAADLTGGVVLGPGGLC